MTNTKTPFSIREALKFGFNSTKSNLIFILGLFVVVVLATGIPNGIQATAKNDLLLYSVISLLTWIINIIVNMGIINISLKLVDKKKTELKDLFFYRNILQFILTSLITGLIVFIGFILLIIPGIIFTIRLQFSIYFVVDKGMHFTDAIKESWRITNGRVWKLFLFGLSSLLVNLLGFILLIVGLFITVPTTIIASSYVYRKLSA